MKLLNVVVMAEDYNNQVAWYKNTLNLEVMLDEAGDYHYTELGLNGQVFVGIAVAKEMDHTPAKPRNNSTLMQISVNDIEAFFEKVKQNKGAIRFGPNVEEQHNFKYGSVEDPEGNEIWVIQG